MGASRMFSAPYSGAGGCRACKRATNLNIVMRTRRSLPAKLRLRFSSYCFLIGDKTTTGRLRRCETIDLRASSLRAKVEKGGTSTADSSDAQPCRRARHHVGSRIVAVVVPLFAPVTFVERGWLSANVLAVTKWLQVLTTRGSAYLHRDSPNATIESTMTSMTSTQRE